MAGFHDTSLRNAYFAFKQVQTPDGKSDKDVVGLHQPPLCPECGSARVWKDGLRRCATSMLNMDVNNDVHDDVPHNVTQRWLCRSCGLRFSLSQNNKKENRQTSGCRVCDAETEGSRNLAAVEKETPESREDSPTLEYAWKLKKRGLSDVTIEARTYRLRVLVRKGANLYSPDSVETVLATESWTQANKLFFVMAYRSFCKTMDVPWTPVKVRYAPKQPFIPLESEIDQLIAGCGKKTATFLQTLKETGARCGEVAKLKWTDINDQNNTIAINDPEKNSNSRTLKVSSKLIAMLNAMPKNNKFIFSTQVRSISIVFARQRNKLSRTLQNPRIHQIHFHTFRHWKATMEYHRTRDILHVKHLLGHKKLENTEIYTHLIDFQNDEYHVKHAKNLEEESKLLESGFEFVRYSMEDKVAIYRKRK